ncbi:hypothetical protein [Nocardiopsis sp. NRRL B-16309]|uniref:hypothetical protein n=1 Tax=Nocardiopsis sp. NRRL B-16309 TaxID=1519494 RepID=UPI0006AFCBE8|nr:hypothetical protein [Nocardiopsis sp. NRRL B-16309]KOX15382.1 hypothetical protein ADL05_15410 [Nocardiopsis sp. NRRL B-16309]
MIVLAVLFVVVLTGAAIGVLALRVHRAARELSVQVNRASGEYQASSAALRERVRRSGAGA